MKIETTLTGTQPLQNGTYNRQITSAMEKVDEIQKVLKEERAADSNEVKTVVDKLNEFTEPLRTNLRFEFHEKLEEYYVTVVNPHTDEVIKEIPPKKLLDMYAAMAEFMGVLVDEKI
ncbi:flagellar protein FlaG [Virgibacillus kekensis]|uniref:Flagellar protein FlaG n=1 Tax=Virgibacillus kekensis TaxID=202261 RepID=A0ABV9DFH5_9BACI